MRSNSLKKIAGFTVAAVLADAGSIAVSTSSEAMSRDTGEYLCGFGDYVKRTPIIHDDGMYSFTFGSTLSCMVGDVYIWCDDDECILL